MESSSSTAMAAANNTFAQNENNISTGSSNSNSNSSNINNTNTSCSNIVATNSSNNSTTTTTTTTTTSNQTGKALGHKISHKKTADSDLKSSIIEFMRSRPFLWNSKHPHYKDAKRREYEFQAFSCQIGHSIQEIKRVWHVLRTNFFRAHKLLLEKPHDRASLNAGHKQHHNHHHSIENGEKLWKYYLAMEYILDGTTNNDDSFKSEHNQSSLSMKGEHQVSLHQQHPPLTRHTKNSKVLRDSRASRGSLKDTSTTSSVTTNDINNRVNKSAGNNNHSNNLNASSNSIRNRSLSTTFNDSITMEVDDDHLYARSLTSTLKKFDPTTKEIIKLKFQEIIVSYMQQQQDQSNPSAQSQDNNKTNSS